MNTLKPNQLENVKKALPKVPENKIPNSIKTSEKKLYHLLAVEKKANFKEDKFDYNVKHLKYNQKAYEANRKILPTLGYSEIIILHNPTMDSEEEKAKQEAEAQKKAEDKKQAEELQKTNEAKANELSEKERELEKREQELAAKEKQAKLNEAYNAGDLNAEQLDEMTMEEIKDYANKHNYKFGSRADKAELVQQVASKQIITEKE